MGILDDYSNALKMRATIEDMIERLNKDNNFGGMKWYELRIGVFAVSKNSSQEDLLGPEYVQLFDEAARLCVFKPLAEAALSRLNKRISEMECEIKKLVIPLVGGLVDVK